MRWLLELPQDISIDVLFGWVIELGIAKFGEVQRLFICEYNESLDFLFELLPIFRKLQFVDVFGRMFEIDDAVRFVLLTKGQISLKFSHDVNYCASKYSLDIGRMRDVSMALSNSLKEFQIPLKTITCRYSEQAWPFLDTLQVFTCTCEFTPPPIPESEWKSQWKVRISI